MANHTPGPWTVAGREIYVNADCETHPIAEVMLNHSCRDEDEVEANARLIAAAPDLLSACKALLGFGDAHEGMMFSERATLAAEAIAKAEVR